MGYEMRTCSFHLTPKKAARPPAARVVSVGRTEPPDFAASAGWAGAAAGADAIGDSTSCAGAADGACGCEQSRGWEGIAGVCGQALLLEGNRGCSFYNI